MCLELTKTETELWKEPEDPVLENQRTCKRNHGQRQETATELVGSIAGGNAAERIIPKIKCQLGTIDSGIWNPV